MHQSTNSGGYPAALRFPYGRLAADLRRLGLSPSVVAQKAGLDPSTIQDAVRGRARPAPRTLRKLFTLGIDPAPYASFAKFPTVTLVCPRCGGRRLMERGRLKQAGRRAAGRTGLQRLAEDLYERPCRRCASGAIGRRALRQVNRRLAEQAKGEDGLALLEGREDPEARDDPDAREQWQDLWEHRIWDPKRSAQRRARFREFVKQPRSEKHRFGIARRRVVLVELRYEFHLCPLCGLVTYRHPWHRMCWLQWVRWYAPRHGHVPRCHEHPSTNPRGKPDPARHLKRNYTWLIKRRSGESTSRELLADSASRSMFKSTVTRGMQALIARLPGRWDFVFSEQCQHKGGNGVRQTLVPLPQEVFALCTSGVRDSLIERLHGFEMPAQKIAELTGVDLDQVRGIIARARLRGESSA